MILVPVAVGATKDVRPTTANPVVLKATAEPNQITIGDPIRYTVEIASQGVETIVPVLSGAFGPFSIADFGQEPPQEKDGVTRQVWWYVLTTFETGDQKIPPFSVAYRRGEGEPMGASSNEVAIAVASLLEGDAATADIRDIKPPEEVPFDWRPYLVAAVAVVGALLLAVVLYWSLNRPRRQRIIPPRPAYEVALEQLARLRARNLVQAGELETYYVGLSSIVRRYLESGFQLRAPEMTTEEFLSAAAGDSRLVPAHRRLLGEFLSQADLVKFARVIPTLGDSEAAYEAARRFVDETRPRPTETKVSEAAREAA
jgi:hypothetical protein